MGVQKNHKKTDVTSHLVMVRVHVPACIHKGKLYSENNCIEDNELIDKGPT